MPLCAIVALGVIFLSFTVIQAQQAAVLFDSNGRVRSPAN
jgi:hypothetical protein